MSNLGGWRKTDNNWRRADSPVEEKSTVELSPYIDLLLKLETIAQYRYNDVQSLEAAFTKWKSDSDQVAGFAKLENAKIKELQDYIRFVSQVAINASVLSRRLMPDSLKNIINDCLNRWAVRMNEKIIENSVDNIPYSCMAGAFVALGNIGYIPDGVLFENLCTLALCKVKVNKIENIHKNGLQARNIVDIFDGISKLAENNSEKFQRSIPADVLGLLKQCSEVAQSILKDTKTEKLKFTVENKLYLNKALFRIKQCDALQFEGMGNLTTALQQSLVPNDNTTRTVRATVNQVHSPARNSPATDWRSAVSGKEPPKLEL